jgi:hypothetical protein
VLVRSRAASKIAGMSEQTLALVTGANQGIGYEIAAGLGAARLPETSSVLVSSCFGHRICPLRRR